MVFDSTPLNDGLYFFLQLIHRLYPEDAFHYVIAMAIKEKKTDEEIYKEVQKNLPEIKPFLQKLTFIAPQQRRLKKEMQKQTLQILSGAGVINGSIQVGGAGNYLSGIKKQLQLKGNIVFIDDTGNSLKDIIQENNRTPNESVDLVACYTGLHHYPEEYLVDFVNFIGRVLRKGGMFIMREYDVKTAPMQTFVSVVHSVISISENKSWVMDAKEYRVFRPLEEWVNIVTAYGFEDTGKRITQHKDPTNNTMMAFRKM